MTTLRKYIVTVTLEQFLFCPILEPHHEKTNNVVSEQVRHKPSCTGTEDG